MKFSRIFVLAVVCFIWLASADGSTCSLNPTTYTFTVASLNCTVISDGPLEFLMNSFSVPDAAVTRSYRKNFRPTNPMMVSQNVLIVDLPAGRALFDTGSFRIPERLPGFPAFDNAGQLIRNLRAARVWPSTIDFIFLTHGHIDHVAGLLTEDGGRAFPNAEVFIERIEHLFWSDPSPSAPLALFDADTLAAFAMFYRDSVAPYESAGKLHLVDSENEDEASPVEGVRFISAFGHAPGHCAIEVKQDGERIVFTGDAWVSTVS
eukprot:TRINITY_DN166_c0_g1_i5.p1 TRINITY_DN166_c0_g1~~TRINITY_DN166_c0_g1_i5.p1  ORF type:complete len:263 (-),score=28.25 TRINITY_DN166_c0_g1_i5:111-899(-)